MKHLFLLLAAAFALALPAVAQSGTGTGYAVTAFPQASSITGSEFIYAPVSGVDQYITPAQLKAYTLYNLTLPWSSLTSAPIVVTTGKTVTVNNTLTFAGTDGSTVSFGAGGTVLYAGAIGSTVEAHSANLDTYSGITPGTGVAAALADAVNATGGFITYSGIGGVVEAHSSALDALAALSPPSTSGYILSCSSAGVYSWVPNSASTYTFSSGLQNSSGTISVLFGTTAGTALQGTAIGTTVEAWSANLDALANGSYSGSTNITTIGTLSAGAVPWFLVTSTPTSAAGYDIVNGAVIDSWGTKTPPSGTVVGTSDTQTLTGKSIAASEVNSGTLAIAQVPTGNSSTTVPLGNDTRFPASVTGIRKSAGAGSTDTAASSSDVQALIGSGVYAPASGSTLYDSSLWTVVSTNFTAAAGGNYAVDTRAGAVTATLPATFAAQHAINFRDAYLSWGTNALNVARNGLLINQQTNTYVDAVQGDKLSATSLNGTNITVQ